MDVRTVAYELAADMTVLELLREAKRHEAEVVWALLERLAARAIRYDEDHGGEY